MTRYRIRLVAAFIVMFVLVAWVLDTRHLGFWGDVAALGLTAGAFRLFAIPARLR